VADRVGHAYLFAGPRGTGKTTLARIVAKAVNCLETDPAKRPCNSCEHCIAVNENRFLDLIEMDAASNTGVEDVRDLRDKIGFSPSQGRFKVYIIDEVHMLSTQAFNALLKTLEEPPPHAIFVLATTEIQKIPATVLSRCQRHEFRRVAVEEIVANLRQIVTQEKFQVDEDVLLLIARQATGSIRDAQSLLDQLASGGAHVTLDQAHAVLGTVTRQAVIELVDCIVEHQQGKAMETLRRSLDSGADPRTLARQIVEYLRGVMLIQMGNPEQAEMTKEALTHMAVHAQALAPGSVLKLVRAFNAAATDTRGGGQPSLSLELALAEAYETAPNALPGAPGPAPARRATPSGTSTSAQRSGGTTEVASPPGRKPESAAPRSQVAEAADHDAASRVQPAGPAVAEQPVGISSVGLAQVAAGWKDIRAALKSSHRGVEALLNSCKPVEVHGDELLLGFQSDTVRALMDKSENLEAARKAIETVLGASLRIRCVVVNARGKVPPNLSQDGMVATALDHGGEIVDVQD
jgi:DNA polymerase III subunit gamma/tau